MHRTRGNNLFDLSIPMQDSFQSMHNAMGTFNLHQVWTYSAHELFYQKERMDFLRGTLKIVAKSSPKTSSQVNDFVREILRWKIFSENEVAVIEDILKEASEENFKILLPSGIIHHVSTYGNRNIFVHLFSNANAVDMLKNARFDVNAKGFNGQTALHVAVQNTLPENVELLLQKGADPNAKDDDGETPIFRALWSMRNPNAGLKCVEILFLNGADVQACKHNGDSFVRCAARMDLNLEFLELTLTHLTLREAMGMPIDKSIFERIEMRDFQIYRERVEKMKMMKVCDRVTMFEMITGRGLRGLNAKDCKDVREFLGRQDGSDRLYDNILRYRVDRIVEDVKELKCKLRVVLYESIEALRAYDLVIDKIISFFSHLDLNVLKKK